MVKAETTCAACGYGKKLEYNKGWLSLGWFCDACDARNITRFEGGEIQITEVLGSKEATFDDNTLKAPGKDEDAPPKEGLGWIFPLAMELAGKQIIKGAETYGSLLQSGNGRFMDLPPELFDAFLYSVQLREDMRSLIMKGRQMALAMDNLMGSAHYAAKLLNSSEELTELERDMDAAEEAVMAWNTFDNYPKDITRK